MKNLVIVFTLLLTLVCCTTEADRNRMRALLDRADSMNRAYIPMTDGIDSLLLDATRFYDRHGDANQQMRAHYLLGCAYRDMGEAPAALQSYQDAIDRADTLDDDCDYPQLARVYGQMANVFYQQGLYRELLTVDRQSVKYAWKGMDTLLALRNYEQQFLAYNGLGLVDSAIMVIEDVSKKYTECGKDQNSAISLGLAIKPLINKGLFRKAKDYITIYESNSGRFDSIGNIEVGREVYYKTKGLFFLHTGILDSAEFYFRKELRDGKDYNNQNSAANGLALLYDKTNHRDSAAKYALYAYTMLDSLYAQRATKEVERMQAMYNYTRHQEVAHQEQKKANQRIVIIWICVGIIIVICLLTFIIIRELTRKRKEVEQKYLQSQTAIEQAQNDIAKLQTNAEINKELISEKEQIIREQETIMKTLLQRNTDSHSLADRQLKTTTIYGKFEQLSVVGQKPTNAEWENMKEQIFKCYPGFKDLISKHEYQLNDKEYKTCLLIRIGFKPKMVSHMLDVDPSYISNIRAEMIQKLFNLAGNSKSFDKMLKEIY